MTLLESKQVNPLQKRKDARCASDQPRLKRPARNAERPSAQAMPRARSAAPRSLPDPQLRGLLACRALPVRQRLRACRGLPRHRGHRAHRGLPRHRAHRARRGLRRPPARSSPSSGALPRHNCGADRTFGNQPRDQSLTSGSSATRQSRRSRRSRRDQPTSPATSRSHRGRARPRSRIRGSACRLRARWRGTPLRDRAPRNSR